MPCGFGTMYVIPDILTCADIGVKEVMLYLRDLDGNTKSKPALITLNESYCCTQGLDPSTAYISKMRVTNGGVNNNSGDDNGYGMYFDQVIHNNNVSKYKLVLKGVAVGNVKKYWRIYIDLNGDQVFEANEKLFQQKGKGKIVGYFNVPSSQPAGDYRMRVIMSTGDYVGPCGDFAEGEVEDYTFRRTNNRASLSYNSTSDSNGDKQGSHSPNRTNEVLVSPNPFDGVVTIQWPGDLKVRQLDLYDVTGKRVSTIQIQVSIMQHQTESHDWDAGIYYLKIYSDDGLITKVLSKMSDINRTNIHLTKLHRSVAQKLGLHTGFILGFGILVFNLAIS